MAAAAGINADLMAVVGIFDPSQLPQGPISGKALQGQQMQVDMTNYHYYDNLTRSIAHTGRIILDLIPKIYDKERVMRIIGDDGKPKVVTINQQGKDENGVDKVLNDVTVGEYDIVMETGPGYSTKRQEAVESMMAALTANPNLFGQIGDLVFRNMDFPGAEVIADRLASINPLANIDDQSKIPPQVQMQIKQMQDALQQMGQQNQQLQMAIKQRQDVEEVKQAHEDRRAMLNAQVKVNDQNTRSVTSQNKMEIDALMELILHHMDTAKLEREISARNQEQYGFTNQATGSLQPSNVAQAQ
jgi:SMC interacting uncharacterized protein involved in chromosome segregation